MEGMRLLRTLRLENFLSYGPEGTEIELQPLNVLIGPNGSGKSNLIEAIGLLKAAPADLATAIRSVGGMAELAWKGGEAGTGTSTALDLAIEATVSYPAGFTPLRYRMRLARGRYHFQLVDEAVENEAKTHPSQDDVFFFYRYQDGRPVLSVRCEVDAAEDASGGRKKRELKREEINPNLSVLSQRKDPDQYPEITYLGEVLSEICLFRHVNFGHGSPLRGAQAADDPASFLLESGRNLGIVLNDLLSQPPTKRLLLDKLKRFYEHVEDITTKVYAGTVETLFHERGFAESTPSNRLSDGTLLCLRLLAILCHPSPPPMVCIEEPETGLHPAALPMVGELLIEASQRTQLVVTTHSDTLVSEFSSMPEVVVVCERDDWGSHLRRLDADQLKEFLDRYPLGELWRMGETGGNP